ncbi:MAG TPA: cyclic nucleotide-binding domain-containing protein [Gaiellaceae bacterium]|nr:cyclic nucleotide-binding domain-containing protein [Gaiellaceae bacterium]
MGASTDVLRRVVLFSGLKDKQLKRIAEAMAERTFAAGEKITKEGEISVGFYAIEEGRARVTMSGEDVGELGPGDHFGEIALIAETPRAATVTAETELRCYGITSWDFRALVERNGEIAWEILASTARKLYENAERARGTPTRFPA